MWGGAEIVIDLQGFRFRFSGLNEDQSRRVASRFGSYLAAKEGLPDQAQVHCCAGIVNVPLARFSNERNEYEPLVHHDASGFRVQGYNFRLDARIVDHELIGRLLTENPSTAVQMDVLDNVLRVTAAHAALASGGLLLHSAGIVMNGGAWLMLGRSNAGKSTLAGAALAAGRPILSDDINLLRPDGANGFVSGAVPLTGDLRAHQIAGPDARFPVRGLLWLSQADTLAIEPMSAGEATSRLLACCPVVNTDPYRLDRVFSVIERVLSVLPMHTLKFRRDDPFEAIETMVLESIGPPAA